MPVGIPPLWYIGIGNNGTMPASMRLDAFEAAYERRALQNDNRLSYYTDIPVSGTVYTNTITLDDLTTSGSRSFSFVVTIPKLSLSSFSGASLVANLQAQDSSSPGWATVYTANMTATDTEAAAGFQYEYTNTSTTKDEFRLQIITTGGNSNVLNNQASVDVLFSGNQRRRVISIIGSVETNTESAFGSESEAFITASELTDPKFYMAPATPNKPLRERTFFGAYTVDRITIDRGEGRASMITLSLTKEGIWVDE
jgi:hypothetical protein